MWPVSYCLRNKANLQLPEQSFWDHYEPENYIQTTITWSYSCLLSLPFLLALQDPQPECRVRQRRDSSRHPRVPPGDTTAEHRRCKARLMWLLGWVYLVKGLKVKYICSNKETKVVLEQNWTHWCKIHGYFFSSVTLSCKNWNDCRTHWTPIQLIN